MSNQPTTPGLSVALEGDEVVIRVARDFAVPMLSIFLHSKFADGPRMEFLTSPHIKSVIDALMSASSMTEYMTRRDGMRDALKPVIQLVENEAARLGLTVNEAASLLKSAAYPYDVT